MTFAPMDIYDHALIVAIMVIVFGAAFLWLWRQSEAIEEAGLQRLALTYAIIAHVRKECPEASLYSYQLMAAYFDMRDEVPHKDHVNAIFRGEDPRSLYHPEIRAIWPDGIVVTSK